MDLLVAAAAGALGMLMLGAGLRLVALGTFNPKLLEKVAARFRKEPSAMATRVVLFGAALVLISLPVLAHAWKRLARALEQAFFGG